MQALGTSRALDLTIDPTAGTAKRLSVSVDGGKPQDAEATIDGDRLRLRLGTRVFDLWLEPQAPGGAEFVTVGGDRLRIEVARGAGAASGKGGAAKGGRQPISSPMPGRIVAVKVTAGQAVARGDLLFTLEAMKMQNEFVAPFDGTITSVAAAVGRLAGAGEVLAEIEPDTK